MTETNGYDVVVVGSVNIDIVVRLARRPARGETVAGDQLAYLPGGKGANQASASAAAGARTALIAAVGDDAHGKRLLDGLTTAGVDIAGCTIHAGPTGTAIITVTPDSENNIVVVAAANQHLHRHTALAAPRAACYLTQLEIPLDTVHAVAENAAKHGARFVLNASPMRAVPQALLAAADPLIVNIHEAQQLLREHQPATTSDLAKALRAAGAKSAVVTRGAAGADWADATRSGTIPAPSIQPIDTTGAGDAFAGALAAALASNIPLNQAIKLANIAGAHATQWSGAVAWSF